MLRTELHAAALELGRALRHAPAVRDYRTAAEAFEADAVAQGLMADLRDQQAGLARLQQSGLTPSQEQIDRLRLCQAAVRSNDTIMAHVRATNEVKAYLPTVAQEVSVYLGTDYGRLVAPQSC
jgi:cell fate (sporulation/competence/biofilm development) regulator YlbF (YheA/YmcA/DUF963 family)